MRCNFNRRIAFLLLFVLLGTAMDIPAKEFLTEKEIELVRKAQVIEERVKVYMEAAVLRLKTAEDRLSGKESEPGDPMEFLSPEDMLDGYNQIIQSILLNLEDALENPNRRRADNVVKALQTLRGETEKSFKEIMILKGLAEKKQKEALANLLDEAVAITNEAHDDAQKTLSRMTRKN